MRTLVVDIGGTNIKLLAEGQEEPRKTPSGKDLTPLQMVDAVKAAAEGWEYHRISVGLPAPVANGEPLMEPANLGPGWVGFDFAGHFGKPVKVFNDAAMQCLEVMKAAACYFLAWAPVLGRL